MTAIRGELAPTEQPPAPLQLRDVRQAADPLVWSAPIPERLYKRVGRKRREQHERLTERYQAAEEGVRELQEAVGRARAEDRAAFASAAAGGGETPAAKLPAVEAELLRATEERDRFAALLVDSGRRLVDGIGEEDLAGVLAEAREEITQLVGALPEATERIRADLDRVGAVGREAIWLDQLARKRRVGPYRSVGAAAPPGRLATAAQLARELAAEVDAELRDRERRAAGPVKHPPPRGFSPPEGTWS
jgi:hypothetical protein